MLFTFILPRGTCELGNSRVKIDNFDDTVFAAFSLEKKVDDKEREAFKRLVEGIDFTARQMIVIGKLSLQAGKSFAEFANHIQFIKPAYARREQSG